jgi:hypothetical protein
MTASTSNSSAIVVSDSVTAAMSRYVSSGLVTVVHITVVVAIAIDCITTAVK